MKHPAVWIALILIVFSALCVGGWALSHAAKVADKVADDALINYEDFQEIWNTCQKINTDLGTLRAIPETDQMFAQFSKAATVAGKKQQLSRWVEEYNAKSKMWNRSLWKSKALPYQLSTDNFANFGGVK